MSAEEEARLNWRGKCCNPNTPIGLNSPRDGSKGNSGQVKTLPTVRIYFVSPSGAAPAFSHFSGSKPEKGGISKHNTNSSMPRYSWILFPKSENLDTNTRVEGCWVSAIRDLVFKNIWKIYRLNSRFKMDSQHEFFDFNIRLKGYSIWSATIRRTPLVSERRRRHPCPAIYFSSKTRKGNCFFFLCE